MDFYDPFIRSFHRSQSLQHVDSSPEIAFRVPAILQDRVGRPRLDINPIHAQSLKDLGFS